MPKSQSYEAWLKALNALVLKRLGVGVDDMPDVTMRWDLYSAGDTPEEAFETMLEDWILDDPIMAEVLGL